MSDSASDGQPNASRAEGQAGKLPQLILAAGIVSVFRGLALLVSSAGNMFWPVALAIALLFPIGCGLAYCLLARRVARGNRVDLTVIVAMSAMLFIPFMLLGFLEVERTMAYEGALNKIPLGRWLDLVLYAVQVAALAIHEALLAWIVWSGIRVRKTLAEESGSGSSRSNRPSLGANLLLALVGIVAGYLWTLVVFSIGDQLGLRGRLHPTEFGGQWGEKDSQLAGWIAALSTGTIIVANLLFRWRWWGLTAGLLTGSALSFLALTH